MKLKVKETGKVINAFCVGYVKVAEGSYDGAKEEICFSSFDEGEEGSLYKKSELEPVKSDESVPSKEERMYDLVKLGFSEMVHDILSSRPQEDELKDAFDTLCNAACVFVEGLEQVKI